MSEEFRKILQETTSRYYVKCDQVYQFLLGFDIEEIFPIIIDCGGEENNDISWNFICSHPKLTEELIEQYIDAPWWPWNLLTVHPCVSPELVGRHPDKKWNWNILSRHPCLTMEFVEKHPSKSWDMEFLSGQKESKKPVMDMNAVEHRDEIADKCIVKQLIVENKAFATTTVEESHV